MPDELWDLVQPHLPAFRPRPQGGGTAPLPDRQVFTAIVYVVASGRAWRGLPPSSGVPFQTAHRRFSQWAKAGTWPRLHRAVLGEPGSQGLIDWSRAIADAACVRAKKGGGIAGPSPADRGKPGSKIHVLSERAGLPLSAALPAASTSDAFALMPLARVIPAIRSRRRGAGFGPLIHGRRR